jgi:uncharacterized protein (TIGR02284 family)
MQDLNNGIINQLNHLLTITNDAKNGYALAAEKEEDNAIKESFEHFVAEHAVYIGELKELVIGLGGNVADVFAPAGVINRSWMEIGAVAGDENKEPVINACINGERALIKAYQKTLLDEHIEGHVKKVLASHLNAFEYAVRKITTHLTPTM